MEEYARTKRILDTYCRYMNVSLVYVIDVDRSDYNHFVSVFNAVDNAVDDNYRNYYEIFVYSFCDSDGDGIGDLKGVESKLDYIAELGCNGIWLMPVMPSPTYHKYDVKDYKEIEIPED